MPAVVAAPMIGVRLEVESRRGVQANSPSIRGRVDASNACCALACAVESDLVAASDSFGRRHRPYCTLTCACAFQRRVIRHNVGWPIAYLLMPLHRLDLRLNESRDIPLLLRVRIVGETGAPSLGLSDGLLPIIPPVLGSYPIPAASTCHGDPAGRSLTLPYYNQMQQLQANGKAGNAIDLEGWSLAQSFRANHSWATDLKFSYGFGQISPRLGITSGQALFPSSKSSCREA
jgi:hypothetical protein